MLRPAESLVARSVTRQPGQSETDWDGLGLSGTPVTSLIMLRSLVRFQLAPLTNPRAIRLPQKLRDTSHSTVYFGCQPLCRSKSFWTSNTPGP